MFMLSSDSYSGCPENYSGIYHRLFQIANDGHELTGALEDALTNESAAQQLKVCSHQR